MFFKLLKSGRGPEIFRVGGKILISAEAALAWRNASGVQISAK